MKKKVSVTTTLSVDAYIKIESLAKKNDVSVAAQIRDLLDNILVKKDNVGSTVSKDILNEFPQRFTMAEARAIYVAKGLSARSSERRIKKMLDVGQIKRVGVGVYEKT